MSGSIAASVTNDLVGVSAFGWAVSGASYRYVIMAYRLLESPGDRAVAVSSGVADGPVTSAKLPRDGVLMINNPNTLDFTS